MVGFFGFFFVLGFWSDFFFAGIVFVFIGFGSSFCLFVFVYSIVFDKPFHGLRLFITFIGVIVAFILGVIFTFFEFTNIEIVENGVNEIENNEVEKTIKLTNDKTNIY